MMVEVVDVEQWMATERRDGDCEGDTTRGRGDGRDVRSYGRAKVVVWMADGDVGSGGEGSGGKGSSSENNRGNSFSHKLKDRW